MTEHHTRKVFGDQLDGVVDAVIRLGDIVCDTIPEATRILLESDLNGRAVSSRATT